jgi:hypothetical protein
LNSTVKTWYDGNNQQVNISMYELANQATVQIFNTLGQLFYQKNLNGATKMAVDAASWPAGIYLVTITNQNGRITQKLRIK